METTNTALPSFTIESSPVSPSAPPLIISVPDMPSIDYLVERILHQQMNQLKGRMMNLAEAALPDTRQCNAIKGLMKDALNQAYYNSLREIDGNLRLRGVIPEGMNHAPIMGLDAKGLGDILVD